MFTFKTYLTELLDRTASLHYTLDWPEELEAVADINGRRVMFQAGLNNAKDPAHSFWEVSFKERGSWGHQLSGNRGELEVFASAKAFIQHIVDTRDSPTIVFRADNLAGEDYTKRGELYQKMAVKFKPKNYTLFIDKTLSAFHFVFKPKKEGITDVEVRDDRERERQIQQYMKDHGLD
jgi:hypothetical protein